ncbi:hypothetical protein GCM10009739_24930 [Microbacterium ulmi]
MTYSTKHGSTAEIAQAIADELREKGMDADCVDVAVASVAGFDAVVLGSAVYMGRWLHDARRFLKRHLEALSAIPFWIFSSGPTGEKAEEDLAHDTRWLEPRKVLDLAASAGLRGHIVFAGRLPVDPHGFVETSMVRSTPPDLQDARDWEGIRRWADDIASELERTGARRGGAA